MILPIITAISREVFAQTPRLHEEAALALGATRWEMIRMAVFPYARSGMVSAVMLGLGRALGETMAVAMVLSAGGGISFNLISSSNPATIASNIASNYKEGTPGKIQVLIATGLVLFLVTFLVNFAARWVVQPQRAGGSPDERPPTAPARSASAVGLVHRRAAARAARPPWWPSCAARRRRPRRCCSSAGASSRGRSLAGLVFLVALPAVGRARSRAAARPTDRLMTGLVWAACAVAIVPLVSLLWTVVDRGLPAINATFLTYSMYRTDLDQEVGIYHALIGTLLITLFAAAHLGADRDHGRDLPRRVRQGQPAGALDHLPGRRDDRHPLDRRRPVRLRAVHPDLRPVDPRSASAARSRCRC